MRWLRRTVRSLDLDWSVVPLILIVAGLIVVVACFMRTCSAISASLP
jgi:hypothetical protein